MFWIRDFNTQPFSLYSSVRISINIDYKLDNIVKCIQPLTSSQHNCKKLFPKVMDNNVPTLDIIFKQNDSQQP